MRVLGCDSAGRDEADRGVPLDSAAEALGRADRLALQRHQRHQGGERPQVNQHSKPLKLELTHMVKNKGSVIETFETGTHVIDPFDLENDV